ncbi:MAG: hypothetical protein AB1807_12060 [Pseudomonadota bacterium]
MPVPSSITDLSKVASENSPQGTETVRGTMDDYFRAHASFIRQLFDQLLGPSVTLPSTATVNIGFAASVNIVITGTTQISAFDVANEGTTRWITFTGALTLKYNAASMQLPGAADIVTRAGDVAVFKSLGAGNWKCMAYQRISGTGPVAASTTTDGYLTTSDWNSFNSRLTPAAAAAAFLALTGGRLTGNTTIANNRGILGEDNTGAARQLIGVAPDNNTQLVNVGGANWQIYNKALSEVILNLDNAGNLKSRTYTGDSDERLKKKWRRRPVDFLQRVAGIRKLGDFLWKKGSVPGIGGSAQELEAIWPEAVHTDDKGFKSVNYGAAAFVIAVELARAFFRYVAKTDKRLAKLEGK